MEKTTPHKLVANVEGMVEDDIEAGIPEYHKTNTGEALCQRMANRGIETHFRGDRKTLRIIYTALRWLHDIQPRRYEKT